MAEHPASSHDAESHDSDGPAQAPQPPANQAARPSPRRPSASEAPRLPTALVYDPLFLAHRTPADFPEQPERLRRGMELIEGLIENGSLPADHLVRLAPRPASVEELAAVHTPRYVARTLELLRALAESDEPPDTIRKLATEVFYSPGSYDAVRNAAGAALVALDAIGEGRARNGYALVRPPGHHARPGQAMGFCVFNNVAVAARYAQQRWGWRRVLIVDYDVHHGNGTQEIFYDDPEVVYFSTHQFPWYPGTGGSTERGEGAGLGATINVPLPAASGWSVYDPIFRQVLWPVADRLRPDVILLSAGFDAHWAETLREPPLGEMRLSTPDFSDLTLEVAEIADRYCEGRLVAVQEGGYHLDAVAQCIATLLLALTGSDKLLDTIGQPPEIDFRWNEEAIIRALYELHGLEGYRRKPRRIFTGPNA